MTGPDVFGTRPYASNRDVVGSLVTILRGVTDSRGLQLESFRSRGVRAREIHELMLTDEPESEPGRTADRVGLVGFFEVEQSGVILVGAEVFVGGRPLGRVAGFDQTHMPNHLNICIVTGEMTDGLSLGCRIGDRVRFKY